MNTPVSFELAKLLKEKGFDLNHEYMVFTFSETEKYPEGELFLKPTIAEVVMWLYEKHEIWIGVICDVGNDLLFTFKDEAIKNVKGKLDGLKNKVSIHIRLGDALAHPNIFKLNTEYITNILSEFNDDGYNYIIFCDNFEYIRNWFPEDSSVHFMEYNEIESLYLMTQCDHFILSPSTFSWWGAYLGEKAHSKVYTPDWWFADTRDYTELNLPNWIVTKTK